MFVEENAEENDLEETDCWSSKSDQKPNRWTSMAVWNMIKKSSAIVIKP